MNSSPRPGDSAHDKPATPEPARWSGLYRGIQTAKRVIDRVLATICIVAFVGLVVIVSWQVFTREVLNNSAPWTEEAARYTFIVLAVFAAAYVFSERGHIAVEILVDKLRLGGQRVMAVVIELTVMFFFILVFIVGGSRMADSAWNQAISTLPLSTGQIYLVLPVAGALILFYSAAHIIGIAAGAEKPTPENDEISEAI